MAWSTPPSWASGAVLTASDMTTYVQGNTQHLYDIIHGVTSEQLNILGNVGVGHAAAPLGLLHLASDSSSETIYAGHHVSNAVSGRFRFYKSRGTRASPTIVSASDETGGILWHGYDGAAYIASARILGLVDGTPGVNDMPGALAFATTADGAASPTERVRINALGQILVSDGTLAAPSVAWLSDVNTGIKFGGSADQGQLVAGANAIATWYLDSGVLKFNVADNLIVNSAAASALGSGVGCIGIGNADVNPSTNPSLGGVLWCDAGALKYRGSGGTVTTLGAA